MRAEMFFCVWPGDATNRKTVPYALFGQPLFGDRYAK